MPLLRFRCPHCLEPSTVEPGAEIVFCPACSNPVRMPKRPGGPREEEPEDVIEVAEVCPPPVRRQPVPVERWEVERPPHPRRRGPRADDYEEGPRRATKTGQDEDERPGRRRKRRGGPSNLERMDRVDWGLAFFQWTLVFYVITTVVFLISMPVSAAAKGIPALVMGVLLGLTQLVLAGLGTAGVILCCWVPARSGARGLIISAGVCFGLAVAGFLVSGILGLAGGALGVVSLGVAFLSQLGALAAAVVGVILFFLFLRRLALFLNDPPSAEEAGNLLVWWLALYIGAPLGLVLVGVPLLLIPCIGLVICLGALIALFIYWIKFLLQILNLIGTLRALTTRGD